MVSLRLCSVSEVKPEQPLQVTMEGREPFAVFNVDGGIYVTDDYCTHGKASLSDEGELDGFKIICTWHDGSFDIRTGEILARPCTEPLKTYNATVRDGDVFIETE
jgi:nitrite reductase/ring-hydroxylating ferredoxin subunit